MSENPEKQLDEEVVSPAAGDAPPGEDFAAPAGPATESIEQVLRHLREQNRRLTDQLLRNKAEMDNARKRLTREKEVLGFFISGHPLQPFRPEVELFGTRTTALLGRWSEHPVRVAGVITAVRRQVARKSGKEYARLMIEDFHGTAEVLVFPESWARLNQVLVEDSAVLLTGGYSARDRGEEHATMVVEGARPLAELRRSGAVGLVFRWTAPRSPAAETIRQAAAVCAGHPGAAPVYIEWSDGNGDAVRLRARRFRVEPEEEVVQALRAMLGADAVHYIKAG